MCLEQTALYRNEIANLLKFIANKQAAATRPSYLQEKERFEVTRNKTTLRKKTNQLRFDHNLERYKKPFAPSAQYSEFLSTKLQLGQSLC